MDLYHFYVRKSLVLMSRLYACRYFDHRCSMTLQIVLAFICGNLLKYYGVVDLPKLTLVTAIYSVVSCRSCWVITSFNESHMAYSAGVTCKLRMPSANPDLTDEGSEPFAEVDPTGRFGRYAELLGHGSVKNVYKAFDLEEGRDVAWNQIKLGKFSDRPCIIQKIHSEIELLNTLKHENIIVLYHFWKDDERNSLNFITEACASGNLRDYRNKHRRVSIKALKKWSRQILEGLDYLHTHDPCIIHRDLKCSNIFINGNIGKVKIGDLGMAAVVGKSHAAHSLLGTPEFMAPELYEENYTELVDIYSFGMCLLEMVTLEIPYSECDSIAKIYKKVTNGVKPRALTKVTDAELKGFIEKCIGQPRKRPSASDLLKDPFFHDILNYDDNDVCV